MALAKGFIFCMLSRACKLVFTRSKLALGFEALVKMTSEEAGHEFQSLQHVWALHRSDPEACVDGRAVHHLARKSPAQLAAACELARALLSGEAAPTTTGSHAQREASATGVGVATGARDNASRSCEASSTAHAPGPADLLSSWGGPAVPVRLANCVVCIDHERRRSGGAISGDLVRCLDAVQDLLYEVLQCIQHLDWGRGSADRVAACPGYLRCSAACAGAIVHSCSRAGAPHAGLDEHADRASSIQIRCWSRYFGLKAAGLPMQWSRPRVPFCQDAQTRSTFWLPLPRLGPHYQSSPSIMRKHSVR